MQSDAVLRLTAYPEYPSGHRIGYLVYDGQKNVLGQSAAEVYPPIQYLPAGHIWH